MFFGTLAGLLNRPIAVITRTVISSAAADAADYVCAVDALSVCHYKFFPQLVRFQYCIFKFVC